MIEFGRFDIYWEGHASVRVVDSGFTVAVDPYERVTGDWEADLVLVTHSDSGHLDRDAIEKVSKNSTCVVIPDSIDEDTIPCEDVEKITEGEVIDVFGIEIESVPMYNEHHERGQGFGYRFLMDDTAFYAAGDTGLVEEAFDLENRVDLAFLPVEGEFTMDVQDAVKMAVRIKPQLVIPYHYGPPFFTDEINLKGFRSELEDRNIDVDIMDSENI